MVLLTPKFVLVAILASLTAFSLTPPADAAAIAMRRSDQHHISDSSEAWSGSSPSHFDHPVLPLPARLASASGKQIQDPRGNVKRQSPRDFFASQRRSLTPEDLPPLLTRRDYSHHMSHQSHEHGPPPEPRAQQSTQGGSGSRLYVHVNGVDSHIALGSRSPDPRHRHDHHHHGNHHDHHGWERADDAVAVEGKIDNIHISGRSPLPDPRHHHHHQNDHHHHHRRYFGGNEMTSAKEDNGLGSHSANSRRDHHHHHHHEHAHNKGHGGDKVVIEGDDNNVSVHTRSRIASHQSLDHSPEYPENGTRAGHQHRVHARKPSPRHQAQDGDHVEHSKSHQSGDKDQAEKHPRSVLINSVEGGEKYLVPDDYLDQRVTMIEGDDVSRILSKVKRGDPGIEGVPGSIEIMSQSAKSESGQRIASLVLVRPDSTMAEFGNNTFILNASENNQTQLYMVALNTTDSGVQGEDIPVALKVPVFNPDSASIEGYCATYDPQPPAPAPLSAEPCFYDEPTGPHKSQVFAYTPSTSVIRPMWFGGETEEEEPMESPSSNSTVKPDGTVDPKTPVSGGMTSITDVRDFGNSTAPPSTVASLDNTTELDQGPTGFGSGNDSMVPDADEFAAKAQNVTLIFSPAAPIIPSGSRTLSDDLDEEMPSSDTNSTDTDTSTNPLTSSASGLMNNTESDWTGSLGDSGFPVPTMPLTRPVPSETVSRAAVPSESGTPADDDDKDLSVMVGVVGQDSTKMRAVDTAPYRWKFDREHS